MTMLQQKTRELKDLKVRYHNQDSRHRNAIELWEEKVENLKNEIKKLNDLISMLQQYIKKLEDENKSLADEINMLVQKIVRQKLTNEEQLDLIKDLQGRLSLDSSNSSKPPSTDGYKKVVQNNRVPSGKKPGGQPGHKGHGLSMNGKLKELIESGEVEVEVVEHGNTDLKYVTKYELDVRMKVVVKEHRFHEGETIPEHLRNPINYGHDVKATSTYLSTEGLMAAQRVSEFIKSLTDGALTPSKATILAFQGEMSEKLDGEMDVMREDVLNSPVLNIDDTSLKCTERPAKEDAKNKCTQDGESENEKVMETAEGTTFNLCVRTYSTKNTVYLTLNPRKDNEGLESDNVLPVYGGTPVHDHERKFYKHGVMVHGECNAHVGRALKEIAEFTKHKWPVKIGTLLLNMLEHKKNDLTSNIGAMDEAIFKRYSDEYDSILQDGKKEIGIVKSKSHMRNKEQNLLNRLEKYKVNHLLFAANYLVPYTNNQAERDFRWVKTHEKVSGCHRSYQGAEKMVRVMSFTRTLKKRKMSILDGLKSVLQGRSVLTNN